MLLPLLGLVTGVLPALCSKHCRNVPGSPGYPTNAQWQALGAAVSGRLVRAIPSGEYCRQNNCTDAEWASANWRNGIPGAMNFVNLEQDYDSHPPSLCGRTAPEKCGQGDVPLHAILAENVEDIQAGVNFARKHNLRLSVKASGHDLLGRSTAKDSLLIHTHKLQSIVFTEHFFVGNDDNGSAVTVGSGVAFNALYNASREVNKIFVGGGAAGTVVAAGGYVQGGGHSPLASLHGLAADNALEFHIVTADGVLRRANEVEHSDLFWALRGGGAGSWGVIVNATFRTYPTFEAAQSKFFVTANDSATVGAICEAHARHVFDWESMQVGQSFLIIYSGFNTTYFVDFTSYFPNATSEQTIAALAPLYHDIIEAGGVLSLNTTATTNINAQLSVDDDAAGSYASLGSRLIPRSSYRHSPKAIGKAYERILDQGTIQVASVVLSGTKVAENADIHNAVNPVWRKTKAHIIVANMIPEQGSIDEIHAAENKFKATQLPILKTIQGPVPAAYSNEADPFEDDWQTVFYGSNYHRLSFIKSKYDPTDLFIVKTGVGSERWDSYGLCRV